MKAVKLLGIIFILVLALGLFAIMALSWKENYGSIENPIFYGGVLLFFFVIALAAYALSSALDSS